MNIEQFVKKYYLNFKLKDFCISLFTDCKFPEFEIVNGALLIDPIIIQQYDEKYYVGKIFKNDKKFYFIKEIDKEYNTKIDKLDKPNGDVFISKSDKITLDKDIPNVTDSIKTTYGKFLLNSILLIDPFGELIDYVNDSPMDISTIKDSIMEKILSKSISSEMVYKFFNNFDYISSLCEIFVSSFSEELLTMDIEIEKQKKKLFEKYKDQLDDPIVMVKIEDELIKMDKEVVNSEDSKNYTSKKSYDVHRKRMFSTFGVIDPFGNDKESYYFAKGNLDDGWEEEDLPHIFNEIRKGVYGRGIDTAKGGSATNDISRIFQDTQITSDDCKTKRGIKFIVTKDNQDQLVNRYIVDNEKTILVTTTNVSKYVNKTVVMRSPMTCEIKDNFCYKCGDYLWEIRNLKLLNIVPVTISSTILLISMKSMHGTKAAFYDIEELDGFLHGEEGGSNLKPTKTSKVKDLLAQNTGVETIYDMPANIPKDQIDENMWHPNYVEVPNDGTADTYDTGTGVGIGDIVSKITIDGIAWNDNTHTENETYTLTINVDNPQNQELVYEVTCDDSNVVIVQTGNDHVWTAQYGPYDTDTTITYTITVTNEDMISDSITDIRIVEDIRLVPSIDSLVWNDDTHYENGSYDLVINATDPQNQALVYLVTCDDPNVGIVQDVILNTWHITYGEYSVNTSVIYKVMIVNEDLLTDTEYDAKVVLYTQESPTINSLTWNNDIHEDNEAYILTIAATDPNSQDLTYEVVCDDANVTITQTGTLNIFDIVYPNYLIDTTVIFTATITNEDTLIDIDTDTKLVNDTEISPIIDSLSWDDDIHEESSAYILTIVAHDPQSQNLTYGVVCDDTNVVITQTGTLNIFDIVYPEYDNDTTVIYTVTITNEDLRTDIDTDTKIVAYVEANPVINSLSWNDNTHDDNNSYVLTIAATDPNSQDLTYEVVCDDVNTTITQTGTPHIFDVVYPNYTSDTTVVFTATVTNEDTLIGIDTDTKIVNNVEIPPIIDSLTWNDNTHEESESYIFMIAAHDPQSLDLTYGVVCDDTNVTITQTGTPNIFDVTYPEYDEDTTVIFTATIMNEDLLTDIDTDTKIVAYVEESPTINSLTWNNDVHEDNEAYILTINATDPNSQDLTYEVVCDDVNTTITQTGTLNIFDIVYPNYLADTSVIFTATVINEDTLTDIDTDTKVVNDTETPPIIDSLTWNDDIHEENSAYVFTINAHDPQSLDLTYEVVCDDANVTIFQSANPNIFVITYPEYDEDTTVIFTATVTNEDSRTDIDTDTKIVAYIQAVPNIDSLTWDYDDHEDNEAYILTINATDPNSQDLTYEVVCDDVNTTITQTGTPNIWDVVYPNYTSDTTVVFTATVTNEDTLTDIDTDTKVVNDTEIDPVIDNLSWNDDIHEESGSYVFTINAHDPQNLNLTYEVVCDDVNVTITQTGTPNIWDITYPNYDEDTTVIFTATITNEDSRTDIDTDTKVVAYIEANPTINSLTWNNDIHEDNTTYTLTINATDPNSQDLTYGVVCDDVNTTITQTGTPNIWDVVYPNYTSDITVIFTATVTNEDTLTDIDTDTKIVNDTETTPVIDSLTWDNDDHEESGTYILTIAAHDPQSLDLTYEVVCDDVNVSIIQTGTPHIWNVTYPEYDEDTTVIFTATVTNEDSRIDIDTDTKVVAYIEAAPTINSLTWNDNTHEDNNSYALTIVATDPNFQDLTYGVVCDDVNTTISQSANPNVFVITYPNFTSDTTIIFTATVTNEDTLTDIDTDTKIVDDVRIDPIIAVVEWNNHNHEESGIYIVRILAYDPQGQDITCEVVCDDPNVHTAFLNYQAPFYYWRTTYPEYDEDTTVEYTITVTNEVLLTDVEIDTKVVAYIEANPSINSLTWNDDVHEDNEAYILTIAATDPNSQDLTYEVVCDDANVSITQTGTPHIFDVVYPNYTSDTTVVFTATVTNEDTLTDIDTDTKVVNDTETSPVIDSLTWNDDIHEELEAYILTVNAHDPQSLDLIYEVVCDDANVTITQTGTPHIWNVTYPEYDEDTTVIFTATITNEDSRIDIDTDTKIVAYIQANPIISSLT